MKIILAGMQAIKIKDAISIISFWAYLSLASPLV